MDRLGCSNYSTRYFRIIAGANRRLRQEVDLGNFRSDLYYRLNTLRLNIPPLRDRKQDIPHFVRHFIGQNSAKLGKGLSISREAMTVLKNYPWRGNIRELQNAIERLCVACDLKIDKELVVDALDEEARGDLQGAERIDCMRKNHIFEVLKQCGNNIGVLPASRRTLKFSSEYCKVGASVQKA